jgi:putative methionine-R-sulfoxide reductase with GAF domain
VAYSDFEEIEGKLDSVYQALLDGHAFAAKLETIAALAKRLLARCDAAGFVLQVRGSARSIGVTDGVALEVDLIQYDTGEGPCLEALEQSHVVRIDLVDAGERWTHFGPGALDAGINSVLSLPVTAQGTTVAALNLYSKSRGAFDEAAQVLGTSLADFAADIIAASAIYASSVDLVHEVLEKIAAREMIDNALGVIMGREECTSAEARRRLTQRAAEHGDNLLEAAQWELRELQLRTDDPSGLTNGATPQDQPSVDE